MGAVGASKNGGNVRLRDIENKQENQQSSDTMSKALFNYTNIVSKDFKYPYNFDAMSQGADEETFNKFKNLIKDEITSQYSENGLKAWHSTDFGSNVYSALQKLRQMEQKGDELKGKWSKPTLERMEKAQAAIIYNASAYNYSTAESAIKTSYANMNMNKNILKWIQNKLK